MIQRILDLSDSLAVELHKLSQAPDVITIEEENALKDAVGLLNVFNQATNMLSSDSYPTSSLIIPVTNKLFDNLRSIKPTLKTEMGIILLNKLQLGMSKGKTQTNTYS